MFIMKKLVALLAFITAFCFSQNAGAQWRKLTSGTTDNLYNIQFLNASTGYAVGWNTDGSFLKTTDAGQHWNVMVVPGTYLFGVDFVDSSKGYIAGYDAGCNCGLVKTTQDGGNNWKSITFAESFGFYKVQMLDGNHGYVCGYDGKILYTTDGWRSHDSGKVGNGSAVFRFMHFPNADTGYAAAGSDFSFINVLYKTTDGGRSWSILKDFQSRFSIANVYFITGSTGYLVGNYGGDPSAPVDVIMKTTDGGATWTKKYTSNSSQVLVTSIGFKGSVGYATTSNGGMLKSVDNGETWTAERSPVRDYISQVSVVDSGLAYTAGFNGEIAKRATRFSIEEAGSKEAASMQVYPNPVSNTGYIKIYQPEAAYAEIKLYNTGGKLVKTFFSGSLEAGEHTFTFEKGECAPGVYILDWYSKSEMHVHKLIITN